MHRFLANFCLFLLNLPLPDALPSSFEGVFYLRGSRHNQQSIFKSASSHDWTLLWSYRSSFIRVHWLGTSKILRSPTATSYPGSFTPHCTAYTAARMGRRVGVKHPGHDIVLTVAHRYTTLRGHLGLLKTTNWSKKWKGIQNRRHCTRL